MRSAHPRPTFRSLTHAECDALLARNHVGRIAFGFHDRVDIQPISYAYEAGWLYGRTSPGAKLVTLAHNHSVAFEVDEVRGVFDWASVVVHGSFHLLDPEGSARDLATSARAVRLLREITPSAYTDDDPAHFRTVLFHIAIGDVTGRAATPRGGPPGARASTNREPPRPEGEGLPERSGW